ncbi:MAG: potassium channel family protein [Solirubrobacterales bacterium]
MTPKDGRDSQGDPADGKTLDGGVEAPAQPRTARRLRAKPLTARRAARLIAGFTLVATLAAGAFAWLIDRQDFPTLGTGLWWAIQTVTTVGYGDVTPKHTEGRVIATIVMLVGIGFLAVITATITATFIESARERFTGSADNRILEELEQISARLAILEARDRPER